MYGTVARLQVKPGMIDAFRSWAADMSSGARQIPGHQETLIYQLDADPNTLMIAVIFESREAYHANAASPEQHAEYLKMLAFLTTEPEWHDGEAVFYLGGPRVKDAG